MNIKKGDTVKILSGDDKGKTAKVVRAFPKEGKVLVEGVNIVKKNERSKKKDGKGQIVDRAIPIFASKVIKV
ncbi:MAG: 50S ribosomal protein L24 [Candidatus Paceibacterota bacterium]|jgi:large subunit ribosomal protein L24